MLSTLSQRPGSGREPSLQGGGLALALLLYPLLWALGAQISNDYWFVPVGVRVAALLRVPLRWWWALLLGEYVATSAMILYYGGQFTLAGSVMANGVPWLTYALAIAGWRLRSRDGLPRSPLAFTELLLFGLSAAALSAVNLTALRWIDGRLAGEPLVEHLFGLLVGDFVGLVLMTPLLLQLGDPRAAWRKAQVWVDLALSALPLAVLLMLLGYSRSAALPYVAMLALAPPIWMARRSGWRGASMAFAVVSASVYASSKGVVTLQTGSLLQFYLALIGSASLILGSWVSFERRLRQRLERSVGELATANRQLEDQAGEMRELGRRLVRAQEDERARIRADLRGELSQQISILATQLLLLVRRVDSAELLAMLDGLRSHVHALRDAADDCIENLQPRALAGTDLGQAISESPPARALATAGVRMQVDAGSSEPALSEADRLQAYRLAQHLMALALRYPDSLSLGLCLEVDPAPAGSGAPAVRLEALLQCRSPLRLEALRSEPDLQAVRDRMFACGGEAAILVDDVGHLRVSCRFESSADGEPAQP